MFRLWPVILLTSCTTTYNHTPQDTKFDENKRNWIEVYRYELVVAMENDDMAALKIFMEELMKEKHRQQKN